MIGRSVFDESGSEKENNIIELKNSRGDYVDPLSKDSKIKISDISGYIVEKLNISAGEFEINHNLKKKPKYRIILGQVGGGSITDLYEKWDDGKIVLNNPSGTISRLILMIL